MERERVTEHEVHAALRAAARTNMQEVGAVVLETDGTINVLDSTTARHLEIPVPKSR